MKCQPTNLRPHSRLAPRALESAFAPRLPLTVGEDDRTLLWCSVERGLQCIGNRYRDIRAGLSLTQFDRRAVVCTPGQAQQIALPLSGVDCEQHRQSQIGRRGSQKSRNVLVVPNLLD